MAFLDGWRFCPRCGVEGEHRSDHFECPACGHVVWANPAPAVQALVERDGRLLLGRRAYDPSAGLWDLPGGFLEENEHPLDALVRELREETGLEIEPREFVGVWMEPGYQGRTVLCLTWDARVLDGVERPADDVVELAWFAPHELPADDELAFLHFPELLRLWRARHEHP
jgi:ADP-ribose pyrophosphatase YjhB (NUDIX family)